MNWRIRHRASVPACIAMLIGLAWCAQPASAALPPDVPADHWAAPSVEKLADLRLVDLFPNGTFRGCEKLARYDLVKSLDNLAQHLAANNVPLPLPATLPAMPYQDVPADHFAAPSIRRLLWMIPGDKQFFGGGQTMTRLDMAVWLYLMFRNVPQGQAVQLGPSPRDVAGPWVTPARWALAAGDDGLVSRYPDGNFRPNRELSRYEMAYAIYSVLRWTGYKPPEVKPQDQTPPDFALIEPEGWQGTRDFVVVPKVKLLTVSGIAGDDSGIKEVTINGKESALASADAGDLKGVGLAGPVGSRFRAQIPPPGENGKIEIVATDLSGKTTRRVYTPKPPKPEETPPVQNPPGSQRTARKWAVLVGVNQYEDQEAIPTLRYSVPDVKAVYDILVDDKRGGFSRDSVFLLTDDTAAKPTNINITKALNQVARLAAPEDTVLFYFSGHGYEENGRGYILPCNTDIDALSASAIDNNDLTDLLDRMKAGRIISVIDACHSGAVKRGAGGGSALSGQFYSPYKGGQGRAMLSSASPGQKAWEDPKLKHGVFTYYFADGLNGQADKNRDGAVTFIELATYVHDSVQAWAQKNGKEQEPLTQLESFVLSKNDLVIAFSPSTMPKGPLADKKRVVYASLEPEDADFACSLLESANPNDTERKMLQYLNDMVAGKIKPSRYLDLVRTLRPG